MEEFSMPNTSESESEEDSMYNRRLSLRTNGKASGR